MLQIIAIIITIEDFYRVSIFLLKKVFRLVGVQLYFCHYQHNCNVIDTRYLIFIEARFGIPSIYFCSAFVKLLFLCIYRIQTCSAPFNAIDDIIV